MTCKTIVLLTMLTLISACTSVGLGGSGNDAPGVSANRPTGEAGTLGLSQLPDARIPSGECGMILWTLDGSRPSAVFQYVSEKSAQVNLAGEPVTLQRTQYYGASGYGVFERQHFESQNGLKVEISTRFGLEFSEGAYLEQGLIKLSDSTGWSMVTPAAGIAGCRP